jgi:hypothetical protein
MKTPPTVLLELVETSPPMFRVIYVDEQLINNDHLQVGELLTDTEVDFLFEAYGDISVEVQYPKP